MRLLHAISSMDPSQGGTSEAVLQLSREAVREGHEIEIASIDAPGAPWIKKFELPLQPLGPAKTSFRYSGKFSSWLRENVSRYDAVVAHGLWQFTGVAVRQACLGPKGRPYFVFPHGMLDPYFDQFPLKRMKKNLTWAWADYRVLRDARAVFFTSEEEHLGARRSFSSMQAKEIITPLGIDDPPPFDELMTSAFERKVPELAGRRYLLFLGRIHLKKGCDLLLQAWKKLADLHPEVCLVMAGPDQTGWSVELKKIAEERVFWPGMLSGDAKWGALYGADAFVLPSHQENFGLAVAEALACSTRVLLSKKVNIWREIVAAGGGAAAEDSEMGAGELLQDFLALDETARLQSKKAARACFESHFRLTSAARLLHQHIQRLIP